MPMGVLKLFVVFRFEYEKAENGFYLLFQYVNVRSSFFPRLSLWLVCLFCCAQLLSPSNAKRRIKSQRKESCLGKGFIYQISVM